MRIETADQLKIDLTSSRSRTRSDSLLAVVESLYWDQIKPTDSDINRRFEELFSTGTKGEGTSLDISALRNDSIYKYSCDSSFRRITELLCVPAWFTGWVDPNDTDYNFPSSVWEGVCHFTICIMRTGEGAGYSHQFRGGRYGLAKFWQQQVLKLYATESRLICIECVDFYESIQVYSLGRLCQLVQCAIAAGLLRYEDNQLQPVSGCRLASTALAAKLVPAASAEPPNPSTITREATSLSELRSVLQSLFEAENAVRIPLSQLKKKLITQFHLVLNPARLGHVKLSDALRQLEGFTVYMCGNNSFLALSAGEPFTPSTAATACSPRDA